MEYQPVIQYQLERKAVAVDMKYTNHEKLVKNLPGGAYSEDMSAVAVPGIELPADMWNSPSSLPPCAP
eukprot:1158977-Pelagomonas_calceolata.AAC.12